MKKTGLSRFSLQEISHILISVLVMSFLIAYAWKVSIIIALIIIAPAFMLHEVGHKFVAQNFGYFAEYKMWVQGLLLAVLITLISQGRLIFIAPGAVYFAAHRYGLVSKEKIGKIGLAGPIVNLLLAVLFGLYAMLGTHELWTSISAMAAYVNSFLAIFNLIPFPPLDGQKIFSWDKKIWVLALCLGVILFISVGFRI